MKKEFFPIAFKQFFHLNQFSHSIKQFFTLVSNYLYNISKLLSQDCEWFCNLLSFASSTTWVQWHSASYTLIKTFFLFQRNFSCELFDGKSTVVKAFHFPSVVKNQMFMFPRVGKKPMFIVPSGVKSNVRFSKCV